VVIVGISGLRWSDVSPAVTPTLWRLAGQGSVGSLSDFAIAPLTCPADAWLTLNSGARAQSDHPSPGYQAGLLESSSTRQPGLVTLTDLTPTVLGWLGRTAPPGVAGARLTRGTRGALPATIGSLIGRDTAEQAWLSTHEVFFWAYVLADAVVFGVLGLARWPQAWRVAGVFAVSVPAGTFLAGLVPWWRLAHPAAWLYGIAVALAVVIALAALAGTRRRGPLAPFGVVCLFTLAVLGLDVMTGSRLQLDAPFGLSVIESGRYYGIGNEALGVYGVTALFGAAWLGLAARRRYPLSRRPATLAVAAVAVFAVLASGWPGFGAKAGGTIAMVPCFALLMMAVAGVRLTWRRVLLVAVSGVALFAVFALISYFAPVTGASHLGAFAGDVLHGHAGAVLLRKVRTNVGSLALGAYSPLVPVAVVLTGLMLWRPAWFRLKTVPLACAAEPLLGPVLATAWLMPVLGWFADDSGVLVPAAALPLAVPLGIAVLAAAAYHDHRPPTQKVTRAVPAIAHRRRPVPAHDMAAEGDRGGEHPRLRRGDPGGQPPVGDRFGLPAADA
jgi:hypothetical protein